MCLSKANATLYSMLGKPSPPLDTLFI